MEKIFTIKGVLNEAYGIMKPRLWRVIGEFAVLSIVFLMLNFLSGHNFLLALIISSVSALCFTLLSLSYAEKKTFSFDEMLSSFTFKKFGYFFIAYFVAKFFIFAGMLALVIPGIFLSVCLSLVKFIAVEKQLLPWPAMRESFRLTKGNRWHLFGALLVFVLVNILGAICLLVGLLFTLPLTLIAAALIYKKLVEKKPAESESVEVVIEAQVVETA